jgi:hypothetical protein
VDGERGDSGDVSGAAESQLAAAAVDAAGARAQGAARQVRSRRTDSALEGCQGLVMWPRRNDRSRAGSGVLSLRTSSGLASLTRWRPPLRATPSPSTYSMKARSSAVKWLIAQARRERV